MANKIGKYLGTLITHLLQRNKQRKTQHCLLNTDLPIHGNLPLLEEKALKFHPMLLVAAFPIEHTQSVARMDSISRDQIQ